MQVVGVFVTLNIGHCDVE